MLKKELKNNNDKLRVLGIETSCDETAVAILEAKGGIENPEFKVLSSKVLSQIDIHKEYGGVFPALAKREHAKNLIPVLKEILKEANLVEAKQVTKEVNSPLVDKVKEILEREPEMYKNLIDFLKKTELPNIDIIAVTQGPGLEPALWVGLNFAKALSLAWSKPLIPVNHMEGHIVSVLTKSWLPGSQQIRFPAIALLISGGHTQLVLVKDWMDYEIIGETKDDAVGEAFDKVARMLDLPYPGGPQISKLANETREKEYEPKWNLPRPMINTKDFNFSFSGLKTAVLYAIQKNEKTKKQEINVNEKKEIAREFEDAIIEVLLSKTKKAIEKHDAQTLIIGGGVSANEEIRKNFKKLSGEMEFDLLLPEKELSTDNAIMIAIAGYFRQMSKPQLTNSVVNRVNKKTLSPNELRADGNLRL